ncbi:hypothetical protein [Bacillus dakarensis]|uniref:hypothetical protein n=1 Tax=Robertmurraya dakarensis TaxID=1926278 RepID=UPI0009821BF4|nr:hypothetical protein [Bacillus dakarensis]
MRLNGNIIGGEFDAALNEFSMETFKHLETQSTMKQNQVTNLYEYLLKHKHDEDGQVLTLYDQLPLRLTQDEVYQLLEDLEKVRSFYRDE